MLELIKNIFSGEINVTPKEKGQVEKVYAFLRRISPTIKRVLIISVGVCIGFFVGAILFNRYGEIFQKPAESVTADTSDYNSATDSTKSCSVSGINLHGSLLTYVPEHAEGDSFFDYDVSSSEGVVWQINEANNNSDIKAILVEVDSGGGVPVAGEEIANAIKSSEKPVVAVIRGVGASSAYWAISSADKIFASANSDVGSIGVTMSYLSNVEKNKKEGLNYEQITSGKYKDLGTPDKPLTAEDKNLLLRDVNIVYNNFVRAVATNRGLTIAAVKSFADGSSVMGEKAKELGMIDEIGGMTEAESYLEEKINQKVEVCW
ncbi:MAG: signal peptide peptidase SppA [Candidatus Taylorbacteria bacterium]